MNNGKNNVYPVTKKNDLVHSPFFYWIAFYYCSFSPIFISEKNKNRPYNLCGYLIELTDQVSGRRKNTMGGVFNVYINNVSTAISCFWIVEAVKNSLTITLIVGLVISTISTISLWMNYKTSFGEQDGIAISNKISYWIITDGTRWSQ